MLYFLPNMVVNTIAPLLHATVLTASLVTMGFSCVAGAAIALIFGPKLDRATV
jgi:hypothetical protein